MKLSWFAWRSILGMSAVLWAQGGERGREGAESWQEPGPAGGARAPLDRSFDSPRHASRRDLSGPTCSPSQGAAYLMWTSEGASLRGLRQTQPTGYQPRWHLKTHLTGLSHSGAALSNMVATDYMHGVFWNLHFNEDEIKLRRQIFNFKYPCTHVAVACGYHIGGSSKEHFHHHRVF